MTAKNKKQIEEVLACSIVKNQLHTSRGRVTFGECIVVPIDEAEFLKCRDLVEISKEPCPPPPTEPDHCE